MKTQVIVKNGDRFGRLKIVDANIMTNGSKYHLCLCDCGESRKVYHHSLVDRKTKSCGCYSRESATKRATKHGMCNTQAYTSWSGMITRCTNQNRAKFDRYGGRGISVCSRWMDFVSFYKDMGSPPSPNHSLGRVDNNGNYEPDNCRWETIDEQSNNKENSVYITYNGVKKTETQWANDLKLNHSTIRYRRLSGLPLDEVFSKKHRSLKPVTYKGKTKLLTQWFKCLGVPASSYYKLKRKGLSNTQILDRYA